jgi:hypothetical protein
VLRDPCVCLLVSPRWAPSPATSSGYITTQSEIRSSGPGGRCPRSHTLRLWSR